MDALAAGIILMRFCPFRFAVTALLAGVALLPTAVPAASLNVPQTHPRLWYDAQAGSPGAARLARARAFAASNPVPINNWDDATRSRDRALRSLLSGNPADGCNEAISWVRGYNFPSQNDARWSGEQAILVFDWCYPHISAADRTTITNNWNARLTQLNNQSWGGVTMAASNYYWGFLRNSLLWGIASQHHNSQAQSFINHALDMRYRSITSPPLANGSKFQSWYDGFGVGGVGLEGSAYGGAMIYYPAIAFTAATDFGYDAWNVVPFYRDTMYYLSYASTPQPTQARDGAVARYEFFPFNDDENFKDGGTGENDAYGNFLGAMILNNPTAAASRMATSWMQLRGIVPSWWIRSELASASVTATAPVLPLDYYAAGAQFLYGRGSNAAGAANFMLQLGGSESDEAGGGVGHHHHDLGNFQIWRKGRWITRETTGYVNNIVGWNNGPQVDVNQAIAHNTVLFEGRGQIDSRRDWATVRRLQSASDYAFAAVDMTNSYRAPATEPWLAKRDWPFAEVAIREFVYLRALEALVVFDRLKSGSDSLDSIYNAEYQGPRMAGTQVRKTFVLHATGTGTAGTANPFTLGAATASAVVGTQRLDLRTLLPAAPAYRVTQEGGEVGQFRIEYDVSGTEMSYLLNVVSARDAAEVQVGATLADLGDVWQLTLSHPQKGNATLTFQKGEASSGGSVRINQAPAQALRGDVQGMLVTAQGPVWTNAPGMSTGGILPALPVTQPQVFSLSSSSQSMPMAAPAQSSAPGQGTSNESFGAAFYNRMLRWPTTLFSMLLEQLRMALDWDLEQAPDSAPASSGAEPYLSNSWTSQSSQTLNRTQIDAQNDLGSCVETGSGELSARGAGETGGEDAMAGDASGEAERPCPCDGGISGCEPSSMTGPITSSISTSSNAPMSIAEP